MVGRGDRRFRKVGLVVERDADLRHLADILHWFAVANVEIPRFTGLDTEPYETEILSEAGGSVATSAGVTVLTGSMSGNESGYDTVIAIGETKAGGGPETYRWDWLRSCGAQRVFAVGVSQRHHGAASRASRASERSVCVAQAGSGIKVMLGLIAADWGLDVAAQVATKALSATGMLESVRMKQTSRWSGSLIEDIVLWVVCNPVEDLRTPLLARKVGMSERTFFRRFQELVGETPAKFVERVRVQAAADVLETTETSLKTVASMTGFLTVERMRRAFLRRLNCTPMQYRTSRGLPPC